MPVPTVPEFKDALQTRPLNEVLDKYVFSEEPFAFKAQPDAMKTLRGHLVKALPLTEANICVIGSAQTGFSLSPDSSFRPFTEKSDIDVLVVDEVLFDAVWSAMLRWHYPRRSWLDGSDWEWSRRRQKELYWGWFTPDKIRFNGLSLPEMLKPVRDLSTNWFNAFKGLSRYQAFSRRDVNGRLYRSWEHARMYHEDGLRQIRESLMKGK
jgi:hypothetical protein